MAQIVGRWTTIDEKRRMRADVFPKAVAARVCDAWFCDRHARHRSSTSPSSTGVRATRVLGKDSVDSLICALTFDLSGPS